MTSFKQLNLFELKSAITMLLKKLNSVADIQTCLADFEMLDAQEDRSFISKVLFKELMTVSKDKIPVICFLLERYVDKEELVAKLWESLKNQNLDTEVKITILNMLREIDSDWSYETCNEYIDDADSLLDENTKQLLTSAIINPEVQIDFLDFLSTIRTQDKITLLNSFDESDFSADSLANILISVFISEPNSPQGKEALKLLAHTKSQLALNVLDYMQNLATGELLQGVKSSLSAIKLSGMRVDNTKEYYKELLASTTPKDFYVTYPDGVGDCAMIFTRMTKEGKIRFVSIVVNIDTGIKDCFGFFEISEFECSKILERFLRDEKPVKLLPQEFKTILYNAEIKSIKMNSANWKLPYEYVCWKNLLLDIDCETKDIREILGDKLKFTDKNYTNVEDFYKTDIPEHWFLDCGYSEEFEFVLKNLKGVDDLDGYIEKSLDTVFDVQEVNSWKEKLILSAFILSSQADISKVQNVYNISNCPIAMKDIFKTILKRSIYEYLILVKYDKNISSYGLTYEEIDDKIKYIEAEWITNV